MVNRSFERALRVSLAVCLLATALAAPRSLVHAHPSGATPHDHEVSAAGACDMLHSGEEHADEHAVVASSSDVHCHGFLALVGIASHRPVASPPGQPTDLPRDHWSGIHAVPGPLAPRASVGEPCCRPVLPGPALDLPAWDAFSACQDVREVRTALPSLLCDRARHERSGVQLA